MTIALVQQRPIASYVSTYAGTLSDSFASTPAVGSLLIAKGGSYNGSATFTITDNQGGANNWYVEQNDLADTTLYVAWCIVAVASGTFTVNASLSSARRSSTLQISEWSGPAASPLGNVSKAGYTMSRSASTTETGQLLIAVAGGNGTGGDYVNPPSTFTAMDEVNLANCTMATAYRLSTTIGSETAAWTGTGPSDSSNSILVLFKPGAAGPTVTTVSSNSATEGSTIVHTVTLSGATSGSTNFAATLAGVTATGSGTDFTSDLASATYSNGVTFSGGNMVVPDAVSGWTVTIATTGDTLDEANETATLTIGGTAGTLTITDDDAAPTITGTASSTVTAGDPVVITYSPGLSGQTRTYTLALTDGTAVGGTDYDNTTVTGDFAVTAGTGSVSISGSTVTVDPGVTEFTLTIGTTP